MMKASRQGIEKEVVIFLTDMEGYSWRASKMSPLQIQTFMVDYHRSLKEIVHRIAGPSQTIAPSAGDGAVAVFDFGQDSGKAACTTALGCALGILASMERGKLPRTRIGLFSGSVIEAELDRRTVRFGSSFAVASRLERLCAYFGIYLMFGREVARLQTDYQENLVSIGKITPRNFTHPIHIFSLYRPGIHNCPRDIDGRGLAEFIVRKNKGVEFFCGNMKTRISPDFPKARKLLAEAQDLFIQLTGTQDQATERLLEYIRNNPRPDEDFSRVGMRIAEQELPPTRVHLPGLSGKLLKLAHPSLYRTLVEETDWEKRFTLIWYRANQQIFSAEEDPDGIYLIDQGSVDILDDKGVIVNTLNDGAVFGDLGILAEDGKRSTAAVAGSDLVLRKISRHDLEELPAIKQLLETIAGRRETSGQ